MKALLFNTTLFTALLFTAMASHAEMFRWVDEDGKVHIGAKPTEKPPKPVPVVPVNKPVEPQKVTTPVAKPAPAPVPVAKPAPAPVTPPAPVTKPAPAPVAAPTNVAAPPQAPKAAPKASVKKTVVVKKKAPVKKTVAKKAPTKKPEVKKAVVKKKPKKVAKPRPKKVAPVKKKASAKADSKRNEEMCGVFTGYVADYEEKVEGCSKNLCDIYKRSLARYQKKQKSYCGG